MFIEIFAQINSVLLSPCLYYLFILNYVLHFRLVHTSIRKSVYYMENIEDLEYILLTF